MKINFSVYLFLYLFLNSCTSNSEKISFNIVDIKHLEIPTIQGGEPNLFTSESGKVYLSWVEYLSDTTDALMFSTLNDEKWSDANTIASGSDWFVNWADFPSIVAYEDNGQSLAAHWLQKSTANTYDYDIHISQSIDKGVTWMPSFLPHQDNIAAEHGFVSLLPISSDKVFATWLDGRYTKQKEHEVSEHPTAQYRFAGPR